MAVKLSPARRREVLARIRAYMAINATDDEIAKQTGLTLHDVRELRRQTLRAETEALKKRTDADWFSEFRIKAESWEADLDLIIQKARGDGTKQFTAVVGAVRAKCQIAKDVIEMGQTLGIVSRKPQQHEVVGGIAVAQLGLSELRTLIAEQAEKTANMVAAHDEGTIWDVETGPVYRTARNKAPLPPPEGAGAKPMKVIAHSRTRVAKGRRVVRGGGKS